MHLIESMVGYYGKRKTYRGLSTGRTYRGPVRRTRSTSYAKRRRTSAGSSAMRMRTAPGRKSGFRRFVSKRRGLRRLGRPVLPQWFRTLKHIKPPTDVAGNYGNVIKGANNAIGGLFHYKGLAVQDLQNALDFSANTASSNSDSLPIHNTTKAFVTDVSRTHVWKNNSSDGEVVMEFYSLVPRRDIPAALQLTGTAAAPNGFQALICVPNQQTALDYAVGGCLVVDPSTIDVFTDPIVEELKVPGAVNDILSEPTSGSLPMGTNWSPFWSQTMTAGFKIRRLKVRGPQGLSAIHKMQPGQQCTFTGKYSKPFLCSYNKFFMAAHGSVKLSQMWQCLRQTPLIFATIKGGVGHDPTDVTAHGAVGMNPFHVDYQQQWKHKIWQCNSAGKYQWNPTNYTGTNAPVFTAGNVQQAPIVTAALTATTTG